MTEFAVRVPMFSGGHEDFTIDTTRGKLQVCLEWPTPDESWLAMFVGGYPHLLKSINYWVGYSAFNANIKSRLIWDSTVFPNGPPGGFKDLNQFRKAESVQFVDDQIIIYGSQPEPWSYTFQDDYHLWGYDLALDAWICGIEIYGLSFTEEYNPASIDRAIQNALFNCKKHQTLEEEG